MTTESRTRFVCDSCGRVVLDVLAGRGPNVAPDGWYRHPEPGYDADLCGRCMVVALRVAVSRLFATIAALTERAERAGAEIVEWKEWGEGQMNDAVRALELLGKAEARVAELEELVTSLWMHKPGDCDACNKLIARAALEGKR